MTRRKKKTPKHDQPNRSLADSQVAKPRAAVEVPSESRLRAWLLGGMTALLVARPLFPSESAAVNGDGLSIVMLWIALGIFWFLGAIGRPKFLLRLGWTDATVLLLIVWSTVAALWAVHRGTPRPAVNMLWEWVGMGMCFFLARQFIVTPRERRAVAAVMVALAVAISGYGLYQRCYELPQTRAMYEANPDRAMRQAGLWFPEGSPERKQFEDRLANSEPMATFALTNSLAAFLAPWLVMLVGVIGSSTQNRKRLLALAACLIPIAACLLLTKSRSGYAAVCMGALLAWLLGRERRVRMGWKLPAALAGVAVLLLSAALAVEGPTVLGRASKSFGYRLQYWQSTVQMIADHPWTGCGPGNFQEVYTQYKLPEASEEIADPHNFLLEIWATAGTPAAMAFLAVLACFALGDRSQGPEVSTKPQAAESRSAGVSPAPQKAGETPTLRLRDLNSSSDGWLYILGGGVLGFLLSVPVGMLSAAPQGIAVVLLGLPLAAGTVALMSGWIREGRLPSWLPAVCVVALLIDLLAAGGIAMPGVAGTFWLLLALGLEGRRPHVFRTFTAWAALAGLVTLAVACYRTAYEPVLHCQAEMRMADRDSVQATEHLERAAKADPLSAEPLRQLAQRESARVVEHLEAAAAADPLSAEPWRQLAAVEFEAWSRQPDEAAFSRFASARDKALKLAPNSAAMWLTSGDWALRASSKKGQLGKRVVGDTIRFAIESYGRAVQLYPNSARCHANLAEAYLAAGDRAAFRRAAETALDLHRATPHEDKKLSPEVYGRLSRELGENP